LKYATPTRGASLYRAVPPPNGVPWVHRVDNSRIAAGEGRQKIPVLSSICSMLLVREELFVSFSLPFCLKAMTGILREN